MNRLTVIGNVGKDAVVTATKNGSVINFSIAYSRRINGENKTTWYSCSYFKKEEQAIEIADNIKKGTRLYVEGEPQIVEYNGKHSIQIIVTYVERVNNKENEGTNKTATEQANEQIDDGDLPF